MIEICSANSDHDWRHGQAFWQCFFLKSIDHNWYFQCKFGSRSELLVYILPSSSGLRSRSACLLINRDRDQITGHACCDGPITIGPFQGKPRLRLGNTLWHHLGLDYDRPISTGLEIMISHSFVLFSS